MSTLTLPAIVGGKGGRGAVDISQLLGETLSKLISEKRGTSLAVPATGDDNGRISLKEFGDAVVPLGLAPAEVSLIFGHFDKSGTGYISFGELHRELTARVAQRGNRKSRNKDDRIKAIDQSPLQPGYGAVGPSSMTRALMNSGKRGTSQGGIQLGLPLSRSAASLLQAPSWDAVSGTLDPKGLKQAPLWRDDAMDATHGSRSLMRALSAAGSLTRPSVNLVKEQQKKRAGQVQVQRGASAVTNFKPKIHYESFEETQSLKMGEADEFTSKIHDEELVQQQLNVAIAKKHEQITEQMAEQANPLTKEMERVLSQQDLTIEARGNSLLAKANEIRAGNAELRDAVSKLRLERRLHNEFKQSLTERLADLTKQVPALVDRVNVLLFEGEKVQTKRQQTQQDALQHRLMQEDMLQDSSEQLARTEQEIHDRQESAYNTLQRHAQMQWEHASLTRKDQETADAKLGYLCWKTQWWKQEFERLRQATQPMLGGQGLVLDFDVVTRGEELDTSPIDQMMGRYQVLRSDCDSLEHFLDSVLGQQVTQLDLELVKLQGQRQGRDAEAAWHAENVRPASDGELSDGEALKVCKELDIKCEAQEALLRAAFEPTKNLLRVLANPADFATAVREAEAQRLANYAQRLAGTIDDDDGYAQTLTTRALALPAEDGEVAAAPSAAGDSGGQGAGEGQEGEGPADNEKPAEKQDLDAAVTDRREVATSDDVAAAPNQGDDGEGCTNEGSVTGTAADLVDAKAVNADAESAVGPPSLPASFERPSAMLLNAATELEAEHNVHRVKLLDEALSRCKHELLAVHDAAKRFKPILDHLAHPHPSTASKLPHQLQVWGGVGCPEVLSVHAEFKRLANESEKRQREEALREEAAVEESKNAKRSTGAPRASQPPSQPSTSALGGSAQAELPLVENGLIKNQSTPALN